MFKKILFATTGEPSCDDAARVAFDISKRYKAELTVFHVLGLPSRGFGQRIIDSRTGEEVSYDDDYVQWVKEELKNTYERQLKDSSGVQLEALSGATHTEILRFARKQDVDLIIMGSCSEMDENGNFNCNRGTGRTLQLVAKSARCPLLVIGRPVASFWGGFSNIVFGTDFSQSCEFAFQFAYKTAKKLGCKLHIFHALDISSIHSGRMMAQNEIEDKLMEARDRIKNKYIPKLQGFDDYEIEVWEGIPYVEIVKFAREKLADLVVMAHHTRSRDPERDLLGSTLEQAALRATCPVMSVNRPDKIKNL